MPISPRTPCSWYVELAVAMIYCEESYRVQGSHVAPPLARAGDKVRVLQLS